MPGWGEILAEVSASAAANGGRPDFDGIRRKYLTQLHQLTGRDTIVYATDWLRGTQPMSSIDLGDMQGMMEVCQGLKARRLVQEWLAVYMFAKDENGAAKAEATARYFADYGTHQSHSLGITRDQAREHGVNVIDLEDDQALQDAVLSVHHATLHTLNGPTVKIIENHQGKAFVLQVQQIVAMQAPGQGQMGMPFPMPGPAAPSP